RGVPAPGMRAGQHPAACLGEIRQPVGDGLALRDDLAVPELTNVEVFPGICRPAHENIRGALNHALALDHPLTVVRVAARLKEFLVDGGPRLLDLEEERVERATL